MRTEKCAKRHTKSNAPDSHPNSEVKRLKARSVLRWGTAREVLVPLAFCLIFINLKDQIPL